MDINELKNKFKPLSQVKLPEERAAKIFEALEKETVDIQQVKRYFPISKKVLFNRIGIATAAIAIGMFILYPRHEMNKMTPSGSASVSNVIPNQQNPSSSAENEQKNPTESSTPAAESPSLSTASNDSAQKSTVGNNTATAPSASSSTAFNPGTVVTSPKASTGRQVSPQTNSPQSVKDSTQPVTKFQPPVSTGAKVDAEPNSAAAQPTSGSQQSIAAAPPSPASQQSIAASSAVRSSGVMIPAVVTWQQQNYSITGEGVAKPGTYLGKYTHFDLYEIPGVSPNDAIAVQTQTNVYLKAIKK